jgi:uncharacterized protein (TIGR00730 family)
MSEPIKRICVYCGSSPGRDPAYMAAARALGSAMAKARIGLVYGGGSLGLMGETARAVLEAGGEVTGIIPEFLAAKERMLAEATDLVVVKTMHERKMLMFERSDGFAALPGGIGTLEELVEVATWAQLGRHTKPMILCDIGGYWSPLVALLAHMREERFIRASMDFMIDVVASAEAVVPAFEKRLAQAPKREGVSVAQF